MFSEASLLFARVAGTSFTLRNRGDELDGQFLHLWSSVAERPIHHEHLAIANRAHTRATPTIRRHIVLTHGARGPPPIPPNSCRALEKALAGRRKPEYVCSCSRTT
jgi:hypothetical protein